MGEEQDARSTPPGRKLSVSEAALELGISAEAVRSRIKRGTLRSVKEGSSVYVLLPADQARPDRDQTPPEHDQTDAPAGESNALISHLQDEVAYLREENRRKDHIIAGLIERLPPALEARESPTPPPEASEGTRSQDAGDEAHEATERPSGATEEHDPTLRAGEEEPRQRRSLWRWILGGGS